MNRLHNWLCRSALWKKTLQERLPWALAGVELGGHALELGPGPGLTTDLLRATTEHLTVAEVDEALAAGLGRRTRGTNVEVTCADAAFLPFRDGCFSVGVCFGMLHHVSSRESQDRLLREMRRVLQPGAVFAGADAMQSWFMKLIHIGDTFVPVDPRSFGARLEASGFTSVEIETRPGVFRFCARACERASEGREQILSRRAAGS